MKKTPLLLTLKRLVILGPKINIAAVNSMFAQMADYMQWQDGVDAHDCQMLATLHVKILNTSAAQLLRSILPFPVVLKPY